VIQENQIFKFGMSCLNSYRY